VNSECGWCGDWQYPCCEQAIQNRLKKDRHAVAQKKATSELHKKHKEEIDDLTEEYLSG